MTDDRFLRPTPIIDSDHPAVIAYARAAAGDATDPRERAIRLYHEVRDDVVYDPYGLGLDVAGMRASATLANRRGWCVAKAALLAACARAEGIPARLGFADVRNHLQSDRLRGLMGTDLFVWHGYSTLFVGGRWTKASPAFNAELCARFGVPPLDFDGTGDALLHAFAGDGSQYMEYVHENGVFTDLPLERILAAYRAAYPVMTTGDGAGSAEA